MTATLSLLEDLAPDTLDTTDTALSGEVVNLMSKAEARKLTDRLRTNLEHTQELIIKAYTNKVWLSLDYKSWDAYITYEFTGMTLTPPKEERLGAISSYTQAGMSTRAISAVTGLSPATVYRAQNKAQASGLLQEQKTTKSLDGRERPFRKNDPADKAHGLGIDLDEAILDTPAVAFGIGSLGQAKAKHEPSVLSKPATPETWPQDEKPTVSNETDENATDTLLATGFENIEFLYKQLTEQIQEQVMSNEDKNFVPEQYPYSLISELLRSMASSAHLLKRLNLSPDLLGEHEQIASQLETIVTNLDTELAALR